MDNPAVSMLCMYNLLPDLLSYWTWSKLALENTAFYWQLSSVTTVARTHTRVTLLCPGIFHITIQTLHVT